MRDLPLPTLPLTQFAPFNDLRPAPAAWRSLPPRAERHERVASPRLDVAWARSESEVREAQALRYQVFATEMGARLSIPKGAPAGHDIDMFDPFCEHLLVRAVEPEGQPGPVIGTYRVLTPAAAKRAGGLYSDTEFDLTRLRSLRGQMVELGRSCVPCMRKVTVDSTELCPETIQLAPSAIPVSSGPVPESCFVSSVEAASRSLDDA